MASLMQELIQTLHKEKEEYEKFFELSKKKTTVLVEGKVDELQKITEEEQKLVDIINMVDKKRESILKDIGDVLNKKPQDLTLLRLSELLTSQPEEQKELVSLHDELKRLLKNVQSINEQNKDLVNELLKMVAFDMNLVKSMKQAPETANYDRSAANTGELFIGASFVLADRTRIHLRVYQCSQLNRRCRRTCIISNSCSIAVLYVCCIVIVSLWI